MTFLSYKLCCSLPYFEYWVHKPWACTWASTLELHLLRFTSHDPQRSFVPSRIRISHSSDNNWVYSNNWCLDSVFCGKSHGEFKMESGCHETKHWAWVEIMIMSLLFWRNKGRACHLITFSWFTAFYWSYIYTRKNWNLCCISKFYDETSTEKWIYLDWVMNIRSACVLVFKWTDRFSCRPPPQLCWGLSVA